MFNYIKALHIIFVVTWFSGMFYIVRLFVYNREAGDRDEPEKTILRKQYGIMIKRLWFGITWPSAILTLVFGLWLLHFYPEWPTWLVIKLIFVVGLFIYHLSLQYLYRQQAAGRFDYSSQQLRLWNEVPTIILVAVVMLVVVKEKMSWIWGLAGLLAFMLV